MNPPDLQDAAIEESQMAALRALSGEREPQRDLWAGIHARLAQPRMRRRREPSLWPYALAASICLALLTGVLLRAEPESRASASVAVASTTPSAESAVALGADESRPYANGEHALTAAPLSSRTLRTLRSESLDNAPAMVAERAEESGFLKATYSTASSHHAQSQQAILRANLQLVSQAEREVRRALRSDPESISLKSLLTVAQEKRVVLTALLVHEQD